MVEQFLAMWIVAPLGTTLSCPELATSSDESVETKEALAQACQLGRSRANDPPRD